MATVKVTPEMAARAVADVDWAKVDATTDADIEKQIEQNTDAAPDLAVEAAKRAWREPGLAIKDRIRRTREALAMSRPEFARVYHIPLRTLEGWEQGLREPDKSSTAMLKLIAYMPDRTRAVLGEEERLPAQ